MRTWMLQKNTEKKENTEDHVSLQQYVKLLTTVPELSGNEMKGTAE